MNRSAFLEPLPRATWIRFSPQPVEVVARLGERKLAKRSFRLRYCYAASEERVSEIWPARKSRYAARPTTTPGTIPRIRQTQPLYWRVSAGADSYSEPTRPRSSNGVSRPASLQAKAPPISLWPALQRIQYCGTPRNCRKKCLPAPTERCTAREPTVFLLLYTYMRRVFAGRGRTSFIPF